MNKKTITSTLVLLVLTWTLPSLSASELEGQGIENYISQALEQLLGKNAYDDYARQDIQSIKEQVCAVCYKPTAWERMFKSNIVRTVEEVKNKLLSGIIDFVEKQSYAHAYKRTDNIYIAQKVSKNLTNSVTSRILTKSGEFKVGALSYFVGQAFYQTINEQCNRFYTETPTLPERIVICRMCKEGIVKSESISLFPCNHIVCKDCAETYYFTNNGIPRCPKCNQAVDLKNLHTKLNTP